jgi:peptidoglycan DL-endopeptidase CwlS
MNTAHRALLLAAIVMGIAVVSPTSVEAAQKTHTVAAGQSLWKIAHRYHVSVGALCHENGLKEGDSLRAGQVLNIPDGKAKATGTQPPVKPGHKAMSSSNKPEAGQKSTREAKPSGGLPPLAKTVPVSASDDAVDREEQPAPKTTPAARPKPTHAAAKPTHAAAKPAHAANKSSRRHKSAAKNPASEVKRDHKGSTEPAAAKSPRKGTGDTDEGD